jgi:hypothetical protein
MYMKVSVAGELGKSLKVNNSVRFRGKNRNGEFFGCYLGGAVLAVTEPSEWDALFADNDTFFRVLGQKFPWLEGSPTRARNPYEDQISGWYIEVNLGCMTPEEMHRRVKALEPECGECNRFDCNCSPKQAEEVQAEYVTQA